MIMVTLTMRFCSVVQGFDFSGAEQTELYINSVRRIMQLEGIEVNIPTSSGIGGCF